MARRRSPTLALFALALSATPLVVSALTHSSSSHSSSSRFESHVRLVKKSNTFTDPTVLDGRSFDYVIVGGGTAGLVLAARLSENPYVTVAVVEAGADGSQVMDDILAPAQAYFHGIAHKSSPYDWQMMVEPQPGLGGRQVYWPRGKVLGGSSAVNGNYMIRAGQIEHDSWASLYPGSAGTWGWDAIYPYMKKSEHWTAATPANAEMAGMVVDETLHGLDGPVHYSYPGFFYPQVGDWVKTFANLGIPTRDPGGGEAYGAFIATSSLDPSSLQRSYSKNAYLDPASSRSNLVVLTGYTTSKINFDGTTATGVNFQATATSPSYTVNAAREVILAAGVIGSPHLLQLSGVGDSDLLSGFGIDVVVDLPGVGMHLTDHLSGELSFDTNGVEYTGDSIETNAKYAAAQMALWKAGNVSSLYNSPNDAVAYLNLTTLFGEDAAATLVEEINANKDALVEAYSTNSFVQAGYNATYSAEVRDILPSAVGQAEILMANTGTYGAYGSNSKTISIQAAIQHPLSRGSVKINSTSVFDNPIIDAGYLTHPADIQILREAFKFARKLSQTAPLSKLLTTELGPGPSVSTDAEWEVWIRTAVSTEYHPAGSCSMLPQSLGGVVDATMRVHGTSNLRVVDSSIVPIGLAAHMVAPLYGIAEAASDIIVASEKDGSTSASGAEVASTPDSSFSGRISALFAGGLKKLYGVAFVLDF